MRRHKDNNYLSGRTLGIVLVLLLLFILIIWKPFSSKDVLDESVVVNENTSLDSFDDSLIQDSNSTVVTNKKIGEKGLCEKYLFNEGDVLEIASHTVLVEAIGKDSIKVTVDGTQKILSELENEDFNSKLTLGISKGSIFYYAPQSVHNTVEMMVGCNYDDNVNDKYIKEKGESICQEIYDSCLVEFEIDN